LEEITETVKGKLFVVSGIDAETQAHRLRDYLSDRHFVDIISLTEPSLKDIRIISAALKNGNMVVVTNFFISPEREDAIAAFAELDSTLIELSNSSPVFKTRIALNVREKSILTVNSEIINAIK